MCEFCNKEKIQTIENDLEINPLKTETDSFPHRQKLVLAKLHGKYVFYGFNKYHYEDDAIYGEIEVNYCPICGKKLSKVSGNE